MTQLTLSVHVTVLLVSALFNTGCDRIFGQPAKDSGQFELKQDSQGRVIRLDKVSGQVAVVQGNRLIPLGGPADTTSERAIQHEDVATSSLGEVEATGRSKAEPTGALRRQADQEIILITETAPIFTTTRHSGRPLTLAAKGSRFRVTADLAAWYRVEFHDAQLGHRVGYVEKRYTLSQSASSNTEAVDVSIVPASKARVLEPIDVSIPQGPEVQPKGRGNAEPVDVSVVPPPQTRR